MSWDQIEAFHISYGAMIRAVIGGTLVSIVCSVIGCFIILRRMAFLADALAHSMLAGVVGGYLIMKLAFGLDASAPAMLLGAMMAGFVTVGMIGFVTRVSRIEKDTAIGIMYTGIFALGGFVVSMKQFSQHIHIDLYHFVVGSVLSISDTDMWMLAIVTVFVIGIVILFYRQFQITSFDPVMAASIGIPVLAVDYLLTACTSLVVVSGVNIVGIVLVVALVITPAATAYLLFDRLTRMIAAAACFGVSGFWLGYTLATWVGVAPGPAVVLTGTLQFLLVLTISPKYGLIADWLRKTRMIPQQILEDVLGSIRREKGNGIKLEKMLKFIPGNPITVRRAVKQLQRGGLIQTSSGALFLTEAGKHEARRLLRAHRLWETYLDRVGTPREELHQQADLLEHVNDEEAIDYLDDKLGHPLRDPHGAEIPEDFVHLEVGEGVKASLLREGHRAKIVAIDPTADRLGLQVGAIFTTGPRMKNQKQWTLLLEDGTSVHVEHEDADAITVDLIPDDPS